MTDGTGNDPELIATLHANSSFEDAEAALEALVQLKDADFGDEFRNRATELDSEEGRGISVTFYNDESPNSLSLEANSEGQLNIQLQLSGDAHQNASNIINRVLEFVPPITVTEYYFQKDFDIPYQSLALPIKEDTELEIIGLRIKRDDVEYIIQKSDTGISVAGLVEDEFEVGDECPENLITADLEEATNFIEEVL